MMEIHSVVFGKFLLAAQEKIADFHAKRGCSARSCPTLTAIDGNAYIRVERNGRIYCFVAKANKVTKGMGDVREGDVLMAADRNKPARGARSNVFDADHGARGLGEFGALYLNEIR